MPAPSEFQDLYTERCDLHRLIIFPESFFCLKVTQSVIDDYLSQLHIIINEVYSSLFSENNHKFIAIRVCYNDSHNCN